MKGSKLYQVLSTLSQSSAESVQTGNGFSDIDKYLHTERPISEELMNRMIEIDNAGGGIILLVGSAGDGKSHLLSKIKDLVDWGDKAFYNDATASCSPNKTAIETLIAGLEDFSDVNIDTTSNKKVLAINLGKLNAFIDDPTVCTMYGKIINATAPLFDEDDSTPPINSDRIKVVEFSNKQLFEIDTQKSGVEAFNSKFLSTILEKIVKKHKDNPFYRAYEEDLMNNISLKSPIMINYRLLMIQEVRETIVRTIIEAIIRFKLAITPREFLDFIYSILISKTLLGYEEKSNFYEVLLPTLLYTGGENAILEAVSKLDPMKHSSTQHDSDLSMLFTSNKIPNGFIPQLVSGHIVPQELLTRTNQFYSNNGRDVERTTKFLFRLKHLLSYHSESRVYLSFVDILKGIFGGDTKKMMDVYSLVTETIPRHNGSYYCKPNNIPLNIQGGKYKLFADLAMKPIQVQYFFSKDKPWEFYPRFILKWQIPNRQEEINLPMDYSLFSYLYDLREGKLAVTYENEKNIVFSHFLRELASKSDCSDSITIVRVGDTDMVLSQIFNSVQLQ